jgi:hypothetical protein
MIGLAMGAAPVRSTRSHRLLVTVALLCCSFLTLSVGAHAAETAVPVDTLWTQRDGLRVDSSFYVIETWWGGIGRSAQRDLRQRSLDELRQANNDLLNAYSFLVEKRNDPGSHPVPVIDPILSTVWSAVSGQNAKAPLGSLFGWMNQQLLQLEGRGSTEAIIDQLLRDYRSMQTAAYTHFETSGAVDANGLWAANAERGKAVITRIRGLGIRSDSLNAGLSASEQVRTALLKKHLEKPLAGTTGPAKGKNNLGGAGNSQNGNDTLNRNDSH